LFDFYFELQKHNIPVSAIPCLQYKRALEVEATATSEPQNSPAKEHGNCAISSQWGQTRVQTPGYVPKKTHQTWWVFLGYTHRKKRTPKTHTSTLT